MTESPNIHQRLRAVMEECTKVKKVQPQGMRYKVVTHDDVTAMVRPLLIANGIVTYPIAIELNQDGQRTEVNLVMRFVNADNPPDFIEVPGIGYGIDNSDKGPGKAVSYACKYAMLKALMLETGEDSDLEDIPHKPAPKVIPFPKAAQTATKAMVDKIVAGWNALGLTAEDRFSAIDKVGVRTLDELPVDVALAWIDRIETKLSKTS